MKTISKTLTANDVGITGGHQAGMLIPKDPRLLGFFPKLNPNDYNPRCHLTFTDDSGTRWEFAFIYYNNKLFSGTRNEYRLTRMTQYIRDCGLQVDDEVLLSCNDVDEYFVSYRRKSQPQTTKPGFLKLGSGWKIINIQGGAS